MDDVLPKDQLDEHRDESNTSTATSETEKRKRKRGRSSKSSDMLQDMNNEMKKLSARQEERSTNQKKMLEVWQTDLDQTREYRNEYLQLQKDWLALKKVKFALKMKKQ